MIDPNLRVATTIASATEIVCALGGRDNLVAVSHECDYPESVKGLPVCTEPKIDVEGSSSQIDERVKSIVKDALSVYRVDADLLCELKPDVIITQIQCEVCAVSARDVYAAVANLINNSTHLVSLGAQKLSDIWEDFEAVGLALHDERQGRRLGNQIQAQMRSIHHQTLHIASRPRVACIEWIDPLMASGNWMPTLVKFAGGHNLFGVEGEHAPWMTWEQLIERDPDIIIVLPCGFDMERTRQEMPILTNRTEWSELKAVKNGKVYLTDGNQYFNRPGPRLLDSLEILAEIIHPGHFHYGHEDSGWQRL